MVKRGEELRVGRVQEFLELTLLLSRRFPISSQLLYEGSDKQMDDGGKACGGREMKGASLFSVLELDVGSFLQQERHALG